MRNGWVVGVSVCVVITAVFLAVLRDNYQPITELSAVGIPIAVALGALAGLAADNRVLSPQRRNRIAILVLGGFAVYVLVLILYLASGV